MFGENQAQSKKESFFHQIIGAIFFWNQPLANSIHNSFLWCSNLQYIAILLWIQLEIVSTTQKDYFSAALAKVISLLSLGEYIISLPSTSKTISVLLVCVYLVLIFVVVIVMIIRVSIRTQISKFENQFICFLNQFHLALGFWAVNVMLVPLILKDHAQFDETDNFLGIQIEQDFFTGISIAIVTINYIMSLSIAIFSYDPLKSSSRFSTHTPSFQVNTYIFKAVILPIISIDNTSTLNTWLSVLFCFIWSTLRHYQLMRKFPYYHYLPMRHSLLLSSLAFIISGVNLLVLILWQIKSIHCLDIILIEIILVPLMIKVNNNYLQGVIRDYMSKLNRKLLHSKEQVIKQLFAISYAIDNAKFTLNSANKREKTELIIWALSSQCNFTQENLQDNINPNKENFYQQFQSIFVKRFHDKITMILLDSVKHLRLNHKPKILLADHLSTQNAISPLVITNLLGMKAHNGLIQVEATKILRNIQNNLHTSYQSEQAKVLNIKCYVDCQNNFRELLKMVSTNSKSVLDFWISYRKPEQQIMDIFLRSKIIEKDDNELRSFWARSIEPNQAFASSLGLLYSNYLAIVRNASYSAHRVEKLSRVFQYGKSFSQQETLSMTQDMFKLNESIVIYVSMSKDSFSKILDVSPNISKIACWKREELLQSDVNILVPDFMRENHTHLMLKHLESGVSSSRLNKNVEIFLKTKEGWILPCNFHLCLYPYIQQQLIYIGIIEPKRLNNTEQIIISQQGDVVGFTNGVDEQVKNLMTKGKLKMGYFSNIGNDAFLFDRVSIPSEIEPLGNVVSLKSESDQVDLQMDVLSSKRSKENLSTQPEGKIKQMNKKSNVLNQYLQNYNVTESFYNFGRDLYVVLNLEKKNQEQDVLKSKHSVTNPNRQTTKGEKIDIQNKSYKKTPLTPNRAQIASSSQIFFSSNRSRPLNKIKSGPEEAEVKVTKLTFSDSAFVQESEEPLTDSFERKNKAKILYSTYSSQNSSLENQRMDIEQAFYVIPKDKKIRNLSFLLSALISISSILLGCFEARNENTLNLLEGNINIMNNQSVLLINTLTLRRMVSFFFHFDIQIYTLDRYVWAGFPDTRWITHLVVGFLASDLNQENKAIRNSLFKIDDSLVYKFYEKIPVIESKNMNSSIPMRYENPFDLMSEIVAAGFRIKNRPFYMIRADDNDIGFIYKNTENHILSAGERAVSIIVEDVEQKLTSNMTILVVFTIITGVMMIFLLVFFIVIIKDIVEDQNKILDVFLRLEEKSIDNHILTLKKFCEILDEYSIDTKRLNMKLKQISLENKEVLLSKPSNYKRKEMNIDGINNWIRRVIVITCCLLCLVFSGLITLIVLVNQQNLEISRKTNVMATTNSNIYNMAIVFNNIQEYIGTNGTAELKGKSISEDWEKTFDTLALIQNQFIAITDPDVGVGPNPTLLKIMQGNLCDVFPGYSFCESLLSGTIKKGLIRLNSFMMMLSKRMKMDFEQSSRTKQDIIDILNPMDVRESEVTLTTYLLPSYKLIGEIVKEQLYQDFKQFSTQIMKVVIAFIITIVIFGGVLSNKLSQDLLNHKISCRKLLRLVPNETCNE